MTGLLGGKQPTAAKPDPVPQLDQALKMSREGTSTRKRGIGTTLLTGDSGLPDLGATSRPKTYAA